MTYTAWALLLLVAIQAAALVALLVQRARRATAERILREREAWSTRLLDRAPVMIWTARPDTTLDYVNQGCADFTGVPVGRLQDEGWLEAVHPEDRDRLVATYTPAIAAQEPFLVEYRIRRADGAWRWLLAHGVPNLAPDGSYLGYVGCDIDITERKEGEDRIRADQAAIEASNREIQHLAGRLIEAQDVERARIARDLHDDVSQQLAGLSIALSGLKRRMDELHVQEDLRSDLRSIHQRSATLAHNVRNLSHDLHPTVLRHAGLPAALSSHCAELRRAHDTVLTCTAEGDLAAIAPEVALCLYRIAQEALRNVITHAGASRADVRLSCTGEHADITIADDGRGFEVARSLKRSAGLGLVSIAERVKLVGGTVRIVSEPGKGTSVCARVPTYARVTPDGRTDLGGDQRELRAV